MKTENPVVGINFSKADEFLCRYVDFLATKIPVETVNNLFVFTKRNLFMGLKNEEHDKAVRLFLKTFESKMEGRLKDFYRHVPNVTYTTLDGAYANSFRSFIKKNHSNLIFIGKEENSSGEIAKMTIRNVPAQVWVVPEKAEHKIDRILVSLDESKFSETILHKALDLASRITPQPEVTCLYVSHLSYFMELEKAISEGYYSVEDRDLIKKSKLVFDVEKEAFEKFVAEHSREFNLKVNARVIFETRPKSYLALLDYLKENETDLVIMGDRNHSGSSLHLLGRFTKGVISKNNKVPVLVVR